MKIEILHVLGCPNTGELADRLATVIAGRADVMVTQRAIRDHPEATQYRMCGSPTLLINGRDPFAISGVSPSLSCRIYLDESGVLSGAPSLSQLLTALAVRRTTRAD